MVSGSSGAVLCEGLFESITFATHCNSHYLKSLHRNLSDFKYKSLLDDENIKDDNDLPS